MLYLNHSGADANSDSVYARRKDFDRIFAEQYTDLIRLSLQLTADAEKAETCLMLAMKACFCRSSVLKAGAQAWVRRMVIRNAICMLWGRPTYILDDPGIEFHLQPMQFAAETLRESPDVLMLPMFERVALVICVLERYSQLDCALWLRKTPQQVHEAIVRATERVFSAERGESDDGLTSSDDAAVATGNGGNA